MPSLNKVFLMGNLTRDPELKHTEGGTSIGQFGLAVNRQWTDAQGQKQEDVTFVDITVFGRQAETCNEYLRKGRACFVEGRLQFDQWEDRETQQKRSKLKVIAERVHFIGGREGGEGGGHSGGHSSGQSGNQGSGQRQQRPQGGNQRGPGTDAPAPDNGVDFDDIPF